VCAPLASTLMGDVVLSWRTANAAPLSRQEPSICAVTWMAGLVSICSPAQTRNEAARSPAGRTPGSAWIRSVPPSLAASRFAQRGVPIVMSGPVSPSPPQVPSGSVAYIRISAPCCRRCEVGKGSKWSQLRRRCPTRHGARTPGRCRLASLRSQLRNVDGQRKQRADRGRGVGRCEHRGAVRGDIPESFTVKDAVAELRDPRYSIGHRKSARRMRDQVERLCRSIDEA